MIETHGFVSRPSSRTTEANKSLQRNILALSVEIACWLHVETFGRDILTETKVRASF